MSSLHRGHANPLYCFTFSICAAQVSTFFFGETIESRAKQASQSTLGLAKKVLRATQIGGLEKCSPLWHETRSHNDQWVLIVYLTLGRTIKYVEVLWFVISCFTTDSCLLWCVYVYICLEACRGQGKSSIFQLIPLRQGLSVNLELACYCKPQGSPLFLPSSPTHGFQGCGHAEVFKWPLTVWT